MSSTNFIGRDPMQWWIGQVTDPKKGKWNDLLERTKAADGKDIYSHRCRVRIVGYHGNDSDLPDDELPLAHVLLPPNTSTVAGQGQTMRYRGGEVVVGFFLDGEDGQQPIIFGTLFRQTFVRDKLKNAEFKSKKQTDFIPYTPPDSRANAGGHQFAKGNSPVFLAFAAGEVNKVISQLKKENGTNQTATNYTACADNEISKISDAIKDFTKQLNTLQRLNTANSYVNPIFGGVVDIQSEIQLTTNRVHNSMSKLIRRGRSWVIQDTLDKLSTTLKEKTQKPLQAPAGQATNALIDTVFCNFEKIQEGLQDYLFKSFENMVGQVLDVPTCGVENFLGDMFGQINNILDTSLGDMFSQLNNIQGGGIATPSKTFTKAIRFANIITNVLDCDRQNCPENTVYSPKSGLRKAVEDDFQGIIDKMSLNSLVNPLLDNLNNAIPATPEKPDCDNNVLKCGPPRVEFIGGDGHGIDASAVINAVGKIIGVAINGTGFGFTEPPLLSFVDSCENGFGAGGFPVMGNVSPSLDENGNQILNSNGDPVYIPDPNGTELGVVGAVITSSGQGYLPNTVETTRDQDGNLTEKEVTPDPNQNYDGVVSYVTTLEDVIVENTGFGYEDTDTLTVEGGIAIVDSPSSTVDELGDDVIGAGDVTGDIVTGVGAGGVGAGGVGAGGVGAGGVGAGGVGAGGVGAGGVGTGGVGTGVGVDGTRPTLGQAEVELTIRDGFIIDANVVNSGFGFTDLPDLVINSDTGAGAKLKPVLKFTKVDNASRSADTNIPFNRNLPQDAVITVISCITK